MRQNPEDGLWSAQTFRSAHRPSRIHAWKRVHAGTESAAKIDDLDGHACLVSGGPRHEDLVWMASSDSIVGKMSRMGARALQDARPADWQPEQDGQPPDARCAQDRKVHGEIPGV